MRTRIVDKTGLKYGRLTVIERAGKNKHKHTLWRCGCECGNTCIVIGSHLRTGNTKSCGCLSDETNFADIAGRRFGRLVAIRKVNSVRGHAIWRCRCDCGNECDKRGAMLLRGTTKSCGCLQLESIRKTATLHGLSGTNEYYIWVGVKQRARENNLPFDLTVEFVVGALKRTKLCPICGVAMHHAKGCGSPTSPSIDRLVPALGYTKGNVNVICRACNLIKGTATPERLRQVADWIESRKGTL
jgi:hypothetical protein